MQADRFRAQGEHLADGASRERAVWTMVPQEELRILAGVVSAITSKISAQRFEGRRCQGQYQVRASLALLYTQRVIAPVDRIQP
jgi:hypothetical protein